MLRSIAAVFAGFILWTVLWLTGNAGLTAAVPGAFRPDGSTDSAGLLLLILLLSVAFSIVAGFLAATVADTGREMKVAWVLGGIQLAVGIFVQIQYWEVMPVWYHLSFLAFLLPGILVGAKLRLDRRSAAVAAA